MGPCLFPSLPGRDDVRLGHCRTVDASKSRQEPGLSIGPTATTCLCQSLPIRGSSGHRLYCLALTELIYDVEGCCLNLGILDLLSRNDGQSERTFLTCSCTTTSCVYGCLLLALALHTTQHVQDKRIALDCQQATRPIPMGGVVWQARPESCGGGEGARTQELQALWLWTV